MYGRKVTALVMAIGLLAAVGTQAQITENFESLPTWSSTHNASWGGSATWSVVSGGQAGNCLKVSRTSGGSSAQTLVYNISPNFDYTVSIWIKCPSDNDFWAEAGYRLGNHSAYSFNEEASSWTLIQKFSNSGGFPNGNGNVWTEYTANVNSGSNTQVTIGLKLGAGGGSCEVYYDTLAITEDPPPPCTLTECFHSAGWYSSEFNAGWGSAATWTLAAGGTGRVQQAQRTSGGSSSRVQQYNITPGHVYEITMRHQVTAASGNYWMESAYRLGNFDAANFDGSGGDWPLVRKWESGTHAWTEDSATFSAGANNTVSVGIKLGSGGPTVTAQWDYVDLVDLGCDVPSAVCQNVNVTLSPGPGGTVVVDAADVDGGSSASGTCTLDTMQISRNGLDFFDSLTFDCGDVGPNAVTLRVTQSDAQTADCTATVTVGAPDSDGDTFDDCSEECWEDPLKTDPGICGCGVPDTDTDGDGTLDCNDGCPDDINKIDPGQCGCGVEDTDFDGDLIPDCIDDDDDNDGSLDVDDSDDFNPFVCSDTDGDTCDDCSSGTYDPANDGVDTDGDGLCDAGDPALDNALVLDVEDDSLYVQPTESVVIDMNALNLIQPVTGLQAVMNFSSTYFATGPTDVFVAPGGGLWNELIYRVWDAGGDLDVAIGVDLATPGGTQVDATTATITLTPTGVEGTTQLVFRPDVNEIDATFFSDVSHQPVYPNKIDSQWIVIDGTPPEPFTVTPDVVCTATDVELTFATTDALAGIDNYELFVDTVSQGQVTSPHVLDMSGYAEGDYEIVVRAYDKAGNETDSDPLTVSVDQTPPVLSNVVAEQDGQSVLCPAVAIQGTVDIYVDMTDTGCAALGVEPTVTVAGMGTATYVGSSGDTYHYQVEVEATTANGSHQITVEMSDALGRLVTDDTSSICVDKNQVTGTVTMTTMSNNAYDFDRDVVFKATDGAGTVLATWTITLNFVNDPDPDGNPTTEDGVASATYVLTGVPDAMAGLSAKTDWSLRVRTALTLDGDGQATADFDLPGGDLNGTNAVNILDYSILKDAWTPPQSPTGDINGDSSVNTWDYTILKANWFTAGDPE